eukprot:6489118-Amphidinium_carterae.1
MPGVSLLRTCQRRRWFDCWNYRFHFHTSIVPSARETSCAHSEMVPFCSKSHLLVSFAPRCREQFSVLLLWWSRGGGV